MNEVPQVIKLSSAAKRPLPDEDLVAPDWMTDKGVEAWETLAPLYNLSKHDLPEFVAFCEAVGELNESTGMIAEIGLIVVDPTPAFLTPIRLQASATALTSKVARWAQRFRPSSEGVVMVLKLSKEQGEQIRALHAAGKGRNEITRMLGLTSANVTNFCKANGLTFTSSKSLEVARESRSAEMREQRARIAKNAADIAERLQARLMGKTYSYYHHNKNDELVRVELPEAPLRDMGAGLSAINTSMGTPWRSCPPWLQVCRQRDVDARPSQRADEGCGQRVGRQRVRRGRYGDRRLSADRHVAQADSVDSRGRQARQCVVRVRAFRQDR